MSLHWDTNLTPWDWSRDSEFITALADRRDRRTGGRRKGDGAALAEPGTLRAGVEVAPPLPATSTGDPHPGSASAPPLDPAAELMAVTLDEVYAALKPAKASLK